MGGAVGGGRSYRAEVLKTAVCVSVLDGVWSAAMGMRDGLKATTAGVLRRVIFSGGAHYTNRWLAPRTYTT